MKWSWCPVCRCTHYTYWISYYYVLMKWEQCVLGYWNSYPFHTHTNTVADLRNRKKWRGRAQHDRQKIKTHKILAFHYTIARFLRSNSLKNDRENEKRIEKLYTKYGWFSVKGRRTTELPKKTKQNKTRPMEGKPIGKKSYFVRNVFRLCDFGFILYKKNT